MKYVQMRIKEQYGRKYINKSKGYLLSSEWPVNTGNMKNYINHFFCYSAAIPIYAIPLGDVFLVFSFVVINDKLMEPSLLGFLNLYIRSQTGSRIKLPVICLEIILCCVIN